MANAALNVYIGWTGEGALAYEVCRASLLAKASIPVTVHPLRQWELRGRRFYERACTIASTGQRYDTLDGTPFSTDFSFTRFLVPALEAYADRWALYCDSDMLWLDDVAKLMDEIVASKTLCCVQHDYTPSGTVKMNGQTQEGYPRKNWSSLMAMHGKRCLGLLSYQDVNTKSGAYLHRLQWCPNTAIGALDARWNVLHGEQEHPNPGVMHFTLGTPDMPQRAPDDHYSELWWKCARALNDGREIERVREALYQWA